VNLAGPSLPLVEQDEHGGAANGLRTARVPLGKLVGQHDLGIANPDFGEPHFTVRGREPREFGGAKGRLVELDGLGGVGDNQIGRGGVVALRDRFDFSGHGSLHCWIDDS
jgi:hypothetical protein